MKRGKSVYIGAKDDINKAYCNLRDHIVKDIYKDWKKGKMSKDEVMSCLRFLFDKYS